MPFEFTIKKIIVGIKDEEEANSYIRLFKNYSRAQAKIYIEEEERFAESLHNRLWGLFERAQDLNQEAARAFGSSFTALKPFERSLFIDPDSELVTELPVGKARPAAKDASPLPPEGAQVVQLFDVRKQRGDFNQRG